MASPSNTPEKGETDSISSKESAAIVSLYNCWSSASEVDSLVDDDEGIEKVVEGYTLLPDCVLEPEALLDNLKKRCRKEDLPPVPKLRKRKKPNCLFLNYRGATRVPPSALPQRPPMEIGFFDFDIGLQENDALYPFISNKARHDSTTSPSDVHEASQGEDGATDSQSKVGE